MGGNMSVILITGCSSGFGMLTAARLSSVGHTVYATMRNPDKQDDLVKEAEIRGGEVRILPLDVTDDNSILKTIEEIEKEQGRLDVLVNNAGYGMGGFFEDLTEEEIREQMETNFFGTQKVARHALPLMRNTAKRMVNQMKPKVINVSSSSGRIATPGLNAYAASKFALEGFSEGLYHELQPFGVDVVLIEPGRYLTKIFSDNSRVAARSGHPDSPYSPYAIRFKSLIVKMLKTKEGVRDPEEVAKLIERVVSSKRPRFRYPVGRRVRLYILLKYVLPFRWFSGLILKKVYGKNITSMER